MDEKIEKIEAIENTGAEGTSEIGIGTLYDTNKMLVKDKLNELIAERLEEKWNLVYDYLKLKSKEVSYFMLLCKERSDYTIFNLSSDKVRISNQIEEATDILINECLKNRGEIRGIDLTEDEAIEIWLYLEEENTAAAYYLFPYDNGVIEV